MINIDNCEEYYNEVSTIAKAADLEECLEKTINILRDSPLTYELFKCDKPLSFTYRISNSKGDYKGTGIMKFKPAEKLMGKYTEPRWILTGQKGE